MDFHCDGKVNYSEFLAATISTINFNKEEKLWSAFKYFDTTDSGYITLDSVMDALKDSGVIIDEEGLKKTFKELQKKEKKINFKEFKAIALGKDVNEEENEFLSKENEFKNKFNLKLNLNNKDKDKDIESNKEEKIRKIETALIKEEKKIDSQDIFFEKVNFSTNNMNNENGENKENNANSGNKKENKETENKDDNKNEYKFEKKNEGSNIDNSNNNANNSNKNNTKNNNKSSKSNNKSSKSNNKSSKSNNKSSKSNNKSSKSNNKSSKSNVEVLIEEHSIDNNDRFTEVNENQN